ncbi:SDR family oxidoreductase [Flavobacterium agricola]|uniref:SDR family oxidoreductase n=1 Tax=Flavobacterium agricola TaxID=2870839 RepID=A0ABY6LYQ8_9FLAO|nr:SDR family oxidoreductase [Flavobacterium agricola]UYW01462.1 SDR family oxidoreductase [Flavobacterium agricola]
MNLELTNKKVFISGSTSGIGFAAAKQLAQEGAQVIINGRSQKSVDAALAKLNQAVLKAQISGFAADFTDVNSVNQLLKQLGTVDVLINNVGIYEPNDFVEITDEDWYRFFDVNVMSGIRLARAVFPAMLAQNWGRIIFITSESASNIPDEMIHYGTTKAAIHAVSRGLAELTKNTNVTVNTIMPGPTASEGVTEFFNKLAQEQNSDYQSVETDFFKNMRPSSLLQRFAKPEEVANLITYVASPLSSATNGAALRVDGGVVKTIF